MTDLIRRVFPPPPDRPLVPPGLYHRMLTEPPAPPRRLHLRVEPDGRGLLIVNASTVLHMNETATAYAWHMVQGHGEQESAEWIARRFRVSQGKARSDGRRIRGQIESLAEGEDLDPVLVLGLERAEPFAERPAAPYRLDIALTYRLPDGGMDPQARRRVDRELQPEEWKSVVDQAWSAGIPHVIFVGGEPTLRTDLADLIRHAEGLGQVTGVVTAADRLLDSSRVEELSAAGLDHLLLVVDPESPSSFDGLRRGVEADIFCAAHLTIDPASSPQIPANLLRLRDTGVTHLSVSAPAGEAGTKALAAAQQSIAELGLTLVWDLPVPFSGYNPIRLESGLAPEAGGWLYVEPDGDVLPRMGSENVVGNVLRDSIGDMWRNAGEGIAVPAV